LHGVAAKFIELPLFVIARVSRRPESDKGVATKQSRTRSSALTGED